MGGFITILHRGEKPWWQYASETQYDDHEYADDDFQHFATRYSDFYYPNSSRNLVRVKEVFSVGPAENTCGCHGLLALQFPSSLKLMFVSTSEGRRYKQKIYEIYIIKDEKTSHWWEWSQWWQMLPDSKASSPIASDTTFVLQPSTVCNLYSLYFFAHCSILCMGGDWVLIACLSPDSDLATWSCFWIQSCNAFSSLFLSLQKIDILNLIPEGCSSCLGCQEETAAVAMGESRRQEANRWAMPIARSHRNAGQR